MVNIENTVGAGLVPTNIVIASPDLSARQSPCYTEIASLPSAPRNDREVHRSL